MGQYKTAFVPRIAAVFLGACLVGSCTWHYPDYVADPPRGPQPGLRGPGSPTVITVVEGDTYYSIARRHGVKPKKLMQANHANPPYTIYPGDQLVVPRPEIHVVMRTDTLSEIADHYRTDQGRLTRMNDLDNPDVIKVGQQLRLPWSSRTEARKLAAETGEGTRSRESPVPKPTSGGRSAVQKTARASVIPRPIGNSASRLIWPLQGSIISSYGRKSGGLVNEGINIAARSGTPVKAADNGTVIYRGNLIPGYGRLLLVRHTDDLVTAYAHLKSYSVAKGDRVTRGQTIGHVGATGNVESPQLHFEVRYRARSVDPMRYLHRYASAQ